MVKRVRVRVPATIANVGPGFDVFGLCLERPWDEVSLELRLDRRVTVELAGPHEGLPTQPVRNAASQAALSLARQAKRRVGFRLRLHKGVPIGSGLGSSAASAVGGAVAMAALLGVRNRMAILRAAGEGERAACGSAHLDNVAPALLGGFTIVVDPAQLRVVQLTPPPLVVAAAIPNLVIETRSARALLPKSVSRADAVGNLARAAALVDALHRRDYRALEGLFEDALAVPYRARLIPGFEAVCGAAHRTGALGCSISGSGPTVFALARRGAPRIARSMVEAFRKAGVQARPLVSRIGTGAQRL